VIEILHIGAPFGIKGAVRVVLYTKNIRYYKKLFYSTGDACSFHVLREDGVSAILTLEGIIDRNTAEKLKGQSLYVRRQDMPKLKTSEFFINDLIGQTVNCTGIDQNLTIVGVDNFGAGDLIELKDKDDSRFYVPFTEANFPEINGKMCLSENAYKGFKN